MGDSIATSPWWKTAVVYQIYPRSFMDSNGDGVGDLDGITSRLGYLRDVLDVDAIWISPFYPSPMADFGYDVADYTGVDPLFGDLAAFDRLLNACHERRLRVIVDWVPNHSSDQHPWFVDSRSSRDSARRDWYMWSDPGPDAGPPNNWKSVFGGSAWELDEASGQYYLHSFLAEQPDLNWRNPDVVEAMLGTLRFWLDRGVDGFRIDVAHYILKDPDLRDNPIAREPQTLYTKTYEGYDEQIHLYDKGHPDVHDAFRSIRRLVDSYPGDRVLIGEIHEADRRTWASYYGADLDELHLPFDFSLLEADWTASELARLIDEAATAIPPGGWPSAVIGNHDETRFVQRYGYERARLAAMLLLTMRATPTLYYGDEIGMLQAFIAPDRRQDPFGIRVEGRGRDGCRTPMQWDASPGAGFTRGEPWLPIVDPDRLHNVEAQLGDPGSLLYLYRGLLALRRNEPALRSGGHERLSGPDEVLMYRRTDASSSVTVALHFGTGDVSVEVGTGRVALSDAGPMDAAVSGSVRLGPWGGVVVVHD